MNIEFRRANLPAEIRRLVIFDHKAFAEYPGDWFDRHFWKTCDAWWMIVDQKTVGCCAFQPHTDFQPETDHECESCYLTGSLYIVTTGILPQFRRQGFGGLFKHWQVLYARQQGFSRIVTNTRKGNREMIALNQKFGFKILRTAPDYYERPRESTVVMELRL